MRHLAALLVLAARPDTAGERRTPRSPASNGKIAFVRADDIWTMNPDGSDQVNLTNSPAMEREPVWSPDGSRIAYTAPGGPGTEISIMDADGSNVINTGNGVTPDRQPAWSPDGTKLAYIIQVYVATMSADGTNQVALRALADSGHAFRQGLDLDWSPDGQAVAFEAECEEGGTVIGKLTPVASSGTITQFSRACPDPQDPDPVLSFDGSPSWSPDSQRILFSGSLGLRTIRPDGTNDQFLAAARDGVWSPDGSKIAALAGPGPGPRIKVMNADGTGVTDITDGTDPDWQPLPINAYPRPKGASPMQVSLVPAYNPCTAPNSTHGAPLSFSSCTPPQPASAHLTTGTPDANGRPVRMSAALTFKVVSGDVQIQAHLNDVANQDLTDYTGSLRATMPVRITDKLNTPHPGGPGAATTQPFIYGFTIPCTADPGPTTGSDCTLATSMNALAPGTHADGRRAVWQLGGVRVFDGGSDADGSTTADNTVFAVQGVFVP